MEWLVTISIIAPAVWMSARRSSWLLDYAIIVLAFNRGLRRIVDYYINGEFNPYSPISLTPLVVAALLLFPALDQFKRLSGPARTPFYLLAGAIAFGLGVGFINNRLAAVYSLAEWMSAIGAMAFAATQTATAKAADRWIKTAGWCAVGVTIYGWWQYYTIPPWDAMWLVQSGMAGYMGIPEPTLMMVFSTLNERGPCGTFLAWAVIPMIIEPRWRNKGGWLSIALLLSGILLTQTRTNIIIIGVVSLLYPLLSKARNVGGLLLLAAVIVGGATWGVQKIPGMEIMRDKFAAEALYGEGSSLQGRLSNYEYGFRNVLTNPFGRGLGSSGMGRRAEGGALAEKGETIQVAGDSGYIQIFFQFGWAGAVCFFWALYAVWRELGQRWKSGSPLLGKRGVDPFVPATRAILLGSLVFLFVGDSFAGFSLLWVFFGRSLSPFTDPVFFARLRFLLSERKKRMQEEHAGAVLIHRA